MVVASEMHALIYENFTKVDICICMDGSDTAIGDTVVYVASYIGGFHSSVWREDGIGGDLCFWFDYK